jgi:hypothetical protein
MRTEEQIAADAADKSAFSNGTEYEIWAGRWCYECVNDNAETETYCPILSVALLGSWPTEWTRRRVEWQIGDGSGSYEAVDTCTEFERRCEGGGDPEPTPEPPPVIDGQVDMFEVFADQIAEQASTREAVSAR